MAQQSLIQARMEISIFFNDYVKEPNMRVRINSGGVGLMRTQKKEH